MIVVDASAVIEVLLRSSHAPHIAKRMLVSGTLHPPHLVDLEVAQVLRRYFLNGQISASREQEALQDLADFRLHRYAHYPLLPRIWELRHSVTAYDAAYLALAEVLGAPLLTTDKRLASSTGHTARIELV